MILADPFKCPRTVMDVIFAVRFGDADGHSRTLDSPVSVEGLGPMVSEGL